MTALSFPQLGRQRRSALAALARVSRSKAESVRVLKLGASQLDEVEHNRTVRSSPTMPAIERFTGVLYDALDARSLSAAARAVLDRDVVVQSALFGPIGAADPIPAYRLSAGNALPGAPLKGLWAVAAGAVLDRQPGPVLDLRSKAYAALGPLSRPDAYTVEVVARGDDGEERALNHFNKHGKGSFVRAYAEDEVLVESVDELVEWANGRGITLRQSGERELTLVTAG